MRRELGRYGASLCAVVIALGGCATSQSVDQRPTGPSARLEVSRQFSHTPMLSEDAQLTASAATVVDLLRSHAEVKTGEEGLTISSIDGLQAEHNQRPGEDETTWALNVNGVEADVSPVDYKVYAGDVVQLDLRYWYVTLDVRATAGAFPETFTRGVFGRVFPVTVRCAQLRSEPCRHVKGLLRRAKVPTDGSARDGKLPPRGNPRRAEILVGRWADLKSNGWAARIDAGARYSGVFARFSPGADELRLLDWYAHRVRGEGAGAGLVAAQRPTEEDLQWVITGVDDRGVARAAHALGSPDLRGAFAAAVTADGVERLPLLPR
jgi:hypothetical protein